MAEEEPDRLSQLPDELLQHILHLAPCREAESTAVLSRRWRWLWPPPTGAAVTIDLPCSYRYNQGRPHDALLRGAMEALAAARGRPVARLSINLGEYYRLQEIVADVLSHPAVSRGVLQDVRIGADHDEDIGSYSSWMPGPDNVGVFGFSFGVIVPTAATLRVLHITNCCDLTAPPPATATTFPCLEVLRLRRCVVSLECLQDMVVASPQLAALQLEYVFLSTEARYSPQSLCCPDVTTLVLLNCCSKIRNSEYEAAAIQIQLDVPRVQHFKYRGKISQFTLRSPLPDVRRAYLHILACDHSRDGDHSRDVETCESFWNFLKNFSNTKVLKLKLEWPIDCVAALERRRIRDILVGENNFSTQSIMFCVEHLEMEAPYNPESKDTMGVAIGNLLQCCPGLRDLRLKLNAADQHRRRRNQSTSLQRKAQLDFQKSIDHFRRRRDHPLCGDDDGEIEVSDIPGLSDRWFHINCLQFHLKRLSLQFHMDKDNPNDINIRLVKFFIERGIALEEMYIDDGIMKLWEHMNCKISGYAANLQPFSEHHVLARMSRALSMNRFSPSKITGQFDPHKLEVRRTNPWSTSRNFTILPLADA